MMSLAFEHIQAAYSSSVYPSLIVKLSMAVVVYPFCAGRNVAVVQARRRSRAETEPRQHSRLAEGNQPGSELPVGSFCMQPTFMRSDSKGRVCVGNWNSKTFLRYGGYLDLVSRILELG